MKILVIEDNEFKSTRLMDYLKAMGHCSPVLRSSYNAALREFESGNVYDLILLDISLPGFDEKDLGGNFMPSGGKHLFSRIHLKNIEAKVVVVTLYKKFEDGSLIDELDEFFSQNYSDNYLGYILYATNDTRWQNELSEFLNMVK